MQAKQREVGLDALPHLAALGHAYAAPAGHFGEPDRAFGVQADAVRRRTREVGPDPAAGQRPSSPMS